VSDDTCPSLFINESMPNVHMLLYADEVAMVKDTIGVKVEVCSKYSPNTFSCGAWKMWKTAIVNSLYS